VAVLARVARDELRDRGKGEDVAVELDGERH
jgi:hypothetical protein